MAKQTLDDRIKEAELTKLMAETKLVRKQVNAKWYSGQSLKRITATVLTLAAVVGLVDRLILKDVRESRTTLIELKSQLAQTKLDSLDSERARISATIARLDSLNDSLKRETIALKKKSLKAQLELIIVDEQVALLELRQQNLQEIIALKDSNVFLYEAAYDRYRILWEESQQKLEETEISLWKANSGVQILRAFNNLDSLIYADLYEKYQMIADEDYYDHRLNPEGEGIDNKFDLHIGDIFVLDKATMLYWQKGGSGTVNFAGARKYILRINSENYGGYNDWRLPTLKEAMSLIEPNKSDGLYIDEVFDRTPTTIGAPINTSLRIFGSSISRKLFAMYFLRRELITMFAPSVPISPHSKINDIDGKKESC